MSTERILRPKEVRIPGPDHPIEIAPANGRVRVLVGDKVIALSIRALVLEEGGYPPVFYIPREDADMSLLERTTHLQLLPLQGRLYLLLDSYRRKQVGVRGVELRRPVRSRSAHPRSSCLLSDSCRCDRV